MASVALRDKSMAQGISFIADTLFPMERLFIFAHNQHIQKAVDMTGLHKNMYCLGWHLHQKFGKQYKNIGSFAYEGEILAKSFQNSTMDLYTFPKALHVKG